MVAARARSAGFWLAAALLVLLPGACATVPEDPESRAMFERINDPLEPMNRDIFAFNRDFDNYVAKPAARAFRAVVPLKGRRALRNILNNLRAPVILANDILQGRPDRAGQTLARIVVNSTLGLAGIFDVARDAGLPYHDEDFGQTLAVWGVPPGPYLMLPVFGPSTTRDALGLVADAFLDPLTYVAINNDVEYALAVRALVDGIDGRARILGLLEEIERTSLDFYATIRSLYRQRRRNAIGNGEGAPVLPGPSPLSERKGSEAVASTKTGP